MGAPKSTGIQVQIRARFAVITGKAAHFACGSGDLDLENVAAAIRIIEREISAIRVLVGRLRRSSEN